MPWKPFAGSSDARVELTNVRTIMHVGDALRAIEDGKLSARLIYDESALNKSRLPVVWTSANHWANGSIYGSVEFSMPWASLVAGRKFYWVEAVTKYTPTAYRILAAKVGDLLPLKLLAEYDPETDDGPLRLISGQWYWNSALTSEFMLTGDIGLDLLSELGFVRHHGSICRYGHNNCSEKGLVAEVAAARVVAYVLGNDIHSVDHVLSPAVVHANNRNWNLDRGVNRLWQLLMKGSAPAGQVAAPKDVKNVVRAALVAVAGGRNAFAKDLVSLVSEADLIEWALAEAIKTHFDVSDWHFDN